MWCVGRSVELVDYLQHLDASVQFLTTCSMEVDCGCHTFEAAPSVFVGAAVVRAPDQRRLYITYTNDCVTLDDGAMKFSTTAHGATVRVRSWLQQGRLSHTMTGRALT